MDDAVGDDGYSLIFDTKGDEESSGDSLDDVACVLLWLDAPDSVVAHLDSTSALDGQQTDSWDGINARWKYLPDDGLDLTLVDTES